jgi:hypothetical protein
MSEGGSRKWNVEYEQSADIEEPPAKVPEETVKPDLPI